MEGGRTLPACAPCLKSFGDGTVEWVPPPPPDPATCLFPPVTSLLPIQPLRHRSLQARRACFATGVRAGTSGATGVGSALEGVLESRARRGDAAGVPRWEPAGLRGTWDAALGLVAARK